MSSDEVFRFAATRTLTKPQNKRTLFAQLSEAAVHERRQAITVVIARFGHLRDSISAEDLFASLNHKLQFPKIDLERNGMASEMEPVARRRCSADGTREEAISGRYKYCNADPSHPRSASSPIDVSKVPIGRSKTKHKKPQQRIDEKRCTRTSTRTYL